MSTIIKGNIVIKDNKNFISTTEAAQLSFRSLKSVRNWCKKNARRGWAFKHSNKWYLNKIIYLESVEIQ